METRHPQAARRRLAGGASEAAALAEKCGAPSPTDPEALLIRNVKQDVKQGDKPAVLVLGSDDRGLMYALLDVADRIGWAEDPKRPLSEIRNIAEKPDVPERALSIYTMHREYFESHFYDEEYWARYLDMLAENRFNTFALLLGYAPSNYLAPPYPYFFDVEGFPEVRFEGMTDQQQERNLKMLNRIIDMTHERGLDFTLGVWDQISRPGAAGTPVGLSRDELLPYTTAALEKLLNPQRYKMHWKLWNGGTTRILLFGDPDYARALPSDTQQFLSMEDAAKNRLTGGESAKVHPRESSRWFAGVARDVLHEVEQAEKKIGESKGKEFVSTMVDLKILAHLALYRSRRARAGVSYAAFKNAGDVTALDEAIHHESRAIEAWAGIVEAAGDVYHDRMMFGRNMPPHWKDELAVLKQGLAALKDQRSRFRPKLTESAASIAHVPVRKIAPGRDLSIRATIASKVAIGGARVLFGSERSGFADVAMKPAGPFRYHAVIPAAKVTPGLTYFIEATDQNDRKATYPAQGMAAPIAVTVSSDFEPPAVAHKPATGARAEKPITVTAEVTDPSGVKWVRLRYRSVNQHQDYQTLDMVPTDKANVYRATVPAEHVVPTWDFMYLIEVMDNAGNGKIHPDLEVETPYVVVRLKRS